MGMTETSRFGATIARLCGMMITVTMPLGRLKQVEPRSVWPNEARNFTPWLLGNVDVLSDLLGMDLELEEAEHAVGQFSLDLIGKDQATGGIVIVENQLEQSDHGHLGQLITYAAGTKPTTIVWIARSFRPEHRAAIDWLNQRTDENTNVFGIAIKVVRIGDSEPAPAFELVAQPNGWEKSVRATTSPAGSISVRQALYREFWEQALERVRAVHPDWTRARTSGQSWCDMPTGLGDVYFETAFRRDALVVQLYFGAPDALLNSERLDVLYERREMFETALGAPAVWERMDGHKAARVELPALAAYDLNDREQWAHMINWIIAHQERLRAALAAVGGIALFSA